MNFAQRPRRLARGARRPAASSRGLRPRGRPGGARRRPAHLRRGRAAGARRTRACSWTARPSRRGRARARGDRVARAEGRAAPPAAARVRRALLRRRRRRRRAGHRGRRRPRGWRTASRPRSTACCPPTDVVVHVEPRDQGLDLRERVLAAAMSEPLVSGGARHPDLPVRRPRDGVAASEVLRRAGPAGGARASASASRRRSSPTPSVEAVETHLEPLERPVPQRRASQAELSSREAPAARDRDAAARRAAAGAARRGDRLRPGAVPHHRRRRRTCRCRTRTAWPPSSRRRCAPSRATSPRSSCTPSPPDAHCGVALFVGLLAVYAATLALPGGERSAARGAVPQVATSLHEDGDLASPTSTATVHREFHAGPRLLEPADGSGGCPAHRGAAARARRRHRRLPALRGRDGARVRAVRGARAARRARPVGDGRGAGRRAVAARPRRRDGGRPGAARRGRARGRGALCAARPRGRPAPAACASPSSRPCCSRSCPGSAWSSSLAGAVIAAALVRWMLRAGPRAAGDRRRRGRGVLGHRVRERPRAAVRGDRAAGRRARAR